jgi:2'-5' RNA ligase
LTLRGRKPKVSSETLNLVVGIPLPGNISERIARDTCQIFRNADKAGKYRLLPPETFHVTLLDFQNAQPDAVFHFLAELEKRLTIMRPFQGRMDGMQLKAGEGFGAVWVSFQDSENETLALRLLLETCAADFELPEWQPKELEAHTTVALYKEANLEKLDEAIRGRSTNFGRFTVGQLAVYEYSTGSEGPSFDLVCTKRLDLQGGDSR